MCKLDKGSIQVAESKLMALCITCIHILESVSTSLEEKNIIVNSTLYIGSKPKELLKCSISLKTYDLTSTSFRGGGKLDDCQGYQDKSDTGIHIYICNN